MLKKVILSIILALFSLTVLVPQPIFAQAPNPWWRPTFDQFIQKVDSGGPNEIYGERYTHAQVYWVVHSLVRIITENGIMACLSDPNPAQCIENAIAYKQDRGAIIQLAYFADMLRYVKPASGIVYIQDLARNFNIIPEAKAQTEGFGYRALLPGQSLWSAARNASYALMTIVVLILAFMIMFRYRISPQVVISVQSALPKIAIALVLITFSYAVAGFMVDLAYLTEAIVAALLTSTGAGISTLSPPRIFELMNSFVTGISAFGYLVFLVVFTNSTALLLSPALGAVFGLNILVALIVVVILAIAILRIFWVLLKTYVTVLLLVIAAPFYILGGALNLGGGILGWLRNLVAQLSVFVMVGILILFAHVFVWSTAYSGSAIANAGNGCLTIPIVGQVCIPSLGIATNPYRIILPTWSPSDPARVGAGALPNFGGMDISLIGFFVAFATILAAPSMASAVRNYLLGMRQEGLGPAIGAGIGPIITTPAGFASHRLGQSIYAEEQAAKLQQRGADVRTLQSLRALAERLTRLRF